MESVKLPHDHGMETQFSHMPDGDKFSTAAELFKLLGDSSRTQIFWLLCHCEQCVINLSAMMQMSSPAVSHHLKLLRAMGLVVSRREGKEVYYKAANTELSHQLHLMIEKMVEVSCPGTSHTKE